MEHFISLSIVEKDAHGDVMVTWSYPTVDPEVGSVIVQHAKSYILSEAHTKSSFTKHKATWLYSQATEKGTNLSALPRVESFAIYLCAKDFFPEKYSALLKILTFAYATTGSPIDVLEGLLGVFNEGKIKIAEMTWVASQFNHKKSLLTPINYIIQLLGPQIVVVWSALLIKKRVAVYCEKLGELLACIRALPQLVIHRQDWNLLRPVVLLSELQLEDLKTAGVYVAGFIDPRIKGREDLYDLLIDVSSATVEVSATAKADLTVGSYHKELATWFNEASGRDPDHIVVKALRKRTAELLEKLRGLCKDHEGTGDGRSYVTQQQLADPELAFAPHFARFLYNVALSEGMAEESQTTSSTPS
eukprot:GILK01003542.1.p1 GENE.GILK01003542.1~~GILK01003542.1.p1  ORF type:complete len:371 (-),score=66.77 GILK01003542.1:286-1365(-)